MRDGDELIVFRGVDEDVLERDHDAVREEARELMRSVQEKSAEYAVDRKVILANLASVLFSRSSFFFDYDLFGSPLLLESLPATTLSQFLSFPHFPSSSLSSLIALQLTPKFPQQLSLILKYVPSKITDTLDRLTALYRPDSVVVSSRGRRPWVGTWVALVSE